MGRAEFLGLIDETMEFAPGTLKGPELLASIPEWDSLAAVSFLATLDENLGMNVSGAEIAKCVTVDDLIALVGDRIEG